MKNIILTALIALALLFSGCQAADPGVDPATDQTTDQAADSKAGLEKSERTGTLTSAANESDAVEPETAGSASAENGNAGTELTIAALHQSGYLDYVAQEYMDQNPGVKITINTYIGEERSEDDLSKYQQTLNTAMMSGGGEDIVDASYLNWRRLSDNDMLLNLDDGLSLDNENYYMNIIDGFIYKDKRVVLPLTFLFEGFEFPQESPAADESLEELTLENISAITEKYPNTALTNGGGNGMSARRLAVQLFCRNIDAFMNIETKTVNMNDGQFEEILTKIKAVLETVNPPENNKTGLDLYTPGDPYLINQHMVYSPAMTSMGLIDYDGLFPLTYNGNSIYTVSGFLPAINANTKNKELVFDFIRFMISDEMMVSPELFACTVNRNSVKENAELIFESTAAEGFAPEGFTEESLKKNMALFDEMAEKLTVPEYDDNKFYEFMDEELEEFFLGNIRAKETCDRLQSKLSVYLNE